MIRFALVLALTCAAFSCPAAEASTNAVTAVASPAARTQCEARTKSGTRCKRNALPGERLCRQHKKIEERGKPARQPSSLEGQTPGR